MRGACKICHIVAKLYLIDRTFQNTKLSNFNHFCSNFHRSVTSPYPLSAESELDHVTWVKLLTNAKICNVVSSRELRKQL